MNIKGRLRRHLFNYKPHFISFIIFTLLLSQYLFISTPQVQAVSGDTWWNNAYGYRKILTFNNSAQAENLTDFPVLVKLTASNFDFSKTQSAGQDIRFLDSDNSTELSYEIEKWDSSAQQALIWVKVPQVDASSASDYIYLYYGNPSDSDGQAITSVWNSNYKAVWHLGEDPSATAPQMNDSTSGGSHATSQGTMTSSSQISGQIDGSLNFNGSGQYTEANFAHSGFSAVTVSAWVKTSVASGFRVALVAGTDEDWLFYLNRFDSGKFIPIFDQTSGNNNGTQDSTTSINDGSWHYIVGTNNGTTTKVFVDGNQENSYADTLVSPGSGELLTLAGGYSWNGGIDEVRVSNVARSAAWIAAEYKTMNDTLITFSSENANTIGKNLTLSNNVSSGNNGRTRLSGQAKTDDSTFTISNVQYSVNGGGWNSATATDGSFNSSIEEYYIDFLPTDNNYKEDGYTVRVRTLRNNNTILDNLVFFTPFTLDSPGNNEFTTDELPSFSFKINKGRFQDLKDSLSKFQVMINKDNTGWRTYIDNIPFSYENVKNNGENKQSASSDTSGNGTYENNSIWVNYGENNSSIRVYSKSVDNGGTVTDKYFEDGGHKLPSGSYQWKVISTDKQGHTQETESRYLRINTKQLSVSQTFFPLAVLNISGHGNPDISTTNLPAMKSTYSVVSPNPIFYGIANVDSKVTLELTDKECQEEGGSNCVHTFETISNPESRFGINVPKQILISGRAYTTRLFVQRENDYNELPEFELRMR
ncbi:DUF2341 domain-containing protein [Candidatus Woesebacteria bacterium]|nr:DUF2341 domain-containing protein [Candidatus Woesebacteria bacterium]